MQVVRVTPRASTLINHHSLRRAGAAGAKSIAACSKHSRFDLDVPHAQQVKRTAAVVLSAIALDLWPMTCAIACRCLGPFRQRAKRTAQAMQNQFLSHLQRILPSLPLFRRWRAGRSGELCYDRIYSNIYAFTHSFIENLSL
jgi:hypothetical protein